MATFDKRFGIKEVADVGFYTVGTVKVDASGMVTATAAPVLTLDTLKVSNIEFTAEQAEARGGKGNAPLIIWDYGREATITIEDALLSMETLQAMFGDATNDTVVTINANKFPGTYTIVGQTYARDVDGKDHLFTFVVYKAKVQSEVTLTMEAEGDPTVFNMSLRVLRSEANEATGASDGDMIKLVLVQNSGDTTPSISLPTNAG